MNYSTEPSGISGDLFANMPRCKSHPVVKQKLVPELTVARALCRHLRHAPASRDKQRIAHLICLNLVSMLKHGS